MTIFVRVFQNNINDDRSIFFVVTRQSLTDLLSLNFFDPTATLFVSDTLRRVSIATILFEVSKKMSSRVLVAVQSRMKKIGR